MLKYKQRIPLNTDGHYGKINKPNGGEPYENYNDTVLKAAMPG